MDSNPTVRILSSDDLINLKMKGMEVPNKKGKLYVQSFLIDDTQNNAGDPDPFKVSTRALDELGKSSIGRPWIIPPVDETMHVVGPERQFDAVLEFQKSYSAGEIVSYWINPFSRKVNVIIDVFPEYQDRVKKMEIPPFVSPLVQFDETDPNTGELIHGRIIHLQSVDSAGYDKSIAKFNSVCEGGLQQCMSEMRIKGATSSLNGYQKSHREVLNMLTNTDNIMTEQTNPIKGASGTETVTTTIPETTTIIDVKESKPVTTTKPEQNTESEAVKTLQAQVEQLQKDKDALDAKLKAEEERKSDAERMNIAKEIAQYSIKLHQVDPKDEDKTAKHYFELTNEDKSKTDLKLLHKSLKEQTSKIKGAYGGDVIIASLTSDTETKIPVDYMKLNQELGGRRN